MQARVESAPDHYRNPRGAELRSSCLAILIPLYTVLCVGLFLATVRQTGNVFVYPLDDAYIHMALAKNLATHSLFGVTPYSFAACSSSPLWVFLISGVYLFAGVQTWPPLALNFFVGLVFIFAACEILLRSGASRFGTIISVAAICVFVPLPVMVLSGMEHMLHILLSAVLTFWAATFIVEPKVPAWKQFALPITIAAAVIVRFETLFLVAAIVFLLLLRRRFMRVALVLFAGWVPIAILGLYSVSKGWFWLPTSLLLKGRMPQFSSVRSVAASVGYTAVIQLFQTPHLLVAVIALVAIYLWRSARGFSPWDRAQLMICLAFISILLHLQYAITGWLGRYEGYLLVIAILSLGCADLSLFFQRFVAISKSKSNIQKCLPWSVTMILLLFPLFQHGHGAMAELPGGARSLYRQQYQMAQFLRSYYNTSSVAANDIGAVNFFTRIRCLDLYGLANREVCRLKRAGLFDTVAINRLAMAENTRVAIVYDSWFQDQMIYGYWGPRLPATWRRVAEWRTRDAVLEGGDTISFYAVDPAEAHRLRHNLSEFSVRLPNGTVQSLLPE